MADYENSSAQQAHDIINLLRRLTALSQNPDEDGFLFRLVQSGDREVFGNAHVSKRVMTALKAALESMLACAESDQVVTTTNAALDSRLALQAGEVIASGEWSAAAVAQCNPELYADVTDMYDEIDPQSYLDDVFASADPHESMNAYEQLVTGDWDGGL